jgi:membrane-anchored protein YejM (alkaline phosphatase superfamily)
VAKNVILICLDGARSDFALKSKILRESLPGTLFFSKSITYAPYTNSSVCAVISGCYGNRNGCNSYWNSEKFDHENFKTLTEYLKDQNFKTISDIHNDWVLPHIGFDEYKIYNEDEVDLSKRHPELIEEIYKRNYDKFFLYLHYESIHTTIRKEVLEKYDNFNKKYFENKKENFERYNLLFKNTEEYLKKIFEKITELDLDKNSIIVIYSDHGISLGEKYGERAYGAYCYDYTVKSFATVISTEFTSREIQHQVKHVDLLPTILEKLQIPTDTHFQNIDGISLIPLIEENKMDDIPAYIETGNPLQENEPPKNPNTKAIRFKEWKLIYNEYDNSKELYDLQKDPNEDNNLINTGSEMEKILWQELLKHQV